MLGKLIRFLASGFGLGFIPLAPGTFGSLIGVGLFYALRFAHSPYLVSQKAFIQFTIAFTLVAILASHFAEKGFKQHDARQIVIDEVAGMLVCYAFVPFTPLNLVLGFLLFRLFDIAKIFPANTAQERLAGGLGIVADDIVAGLQAGVVLYYLPWVLAKVTTVIASFA